MSWVQVSQYVTDQDKLRLFVRNHFQKSLNRNIRPMEEPLSPESPSGCKVEATSSGQFFGFDSDEDEEQPDLEAPMSRYST